MKKIYFLLFTFIGFTTYGQNLAVNGSFENWTAGVPDSFDTIDFNSTDLSENTDMMYVTDGASSARVDVMTEDQGITDIRQDIAVLGGVTYTVSLDVYATNNETRARLFGNGYSPSQYSDETILNTWQTISFEYTPAADETLNVGIRFYDLSANWVAGTLFYIDNLQVVAAVDPSIAITSPADGASIPSTDVTVELSVQNFDVDETPTNGGTGDGHIHWTLDGGNQPMKYDTDPIQLTGLAEGEHTVVLTLVDNSHTPIVPEVSATTTFTVTSTNQVATIADLRAGTIENFYELTGEAVITYIVTDNNRNQKYIQDATGAILIDDNGGMLTTAFNIGDGITGLQGELGEYAGTLQFIPTENVASASSTGNTITPEEISVADFLANGEAYESELIKINNVTFSVTGMFEDNTNYDLTDGADVAVARVSFGDENLVGANIPTGTSSVIGLGGQFNADYQVLPRYVTDVEGASLSLDAVTANSFNVYPNPTSTGFVNITSKTNEVISVSVFDILGKQVLNNTVNNNVLNVSSLSTGVYIMKISQNGQSITKKLVIK